ncbi:hypothetical protein [Aeromonas hydrophila]|uniref:hypothetical protein n=1 Tax=Aeromonas hydrophila TaxID=644 RepID=UPI00188E3122|nr:hypothetical protein [Aeromonas hydrophila]ELB2790990.1 hypothetical protein [Aeromonas hydrophila]MBF4798503.1 hypothetical protein [Aeromonas hydrophila]
MKKPRKKDRFIIKRKNEKNRIKQNKKTGGNSNNDYKSSVSSKKLELRKLHTELNEWLEKEKKKGLKISSCIKKSQAKKNMIVVHLPAEMDLENNYDKTIQTFTAIRKLVELIEKYSGHHLPKKAAKLGSVNFDKLKKISTSAALILTAEISRWDTLLRNKLVPTVELWDDEIYHSFSQLGFFKLFSNKPTKVTETPISNANINYVEYFRGSCANSEYARASKKSLKQKILSLVGQDVPEWIFLNGGLSEAVTNVTHHAYPDGEQTWADKSWFLTGSYNKSSEEMTVSFYDLGIGIPNSLPSSKLWEKAIEYMDKFNIPLAKRNMDRILLKAAVNLSRTRTGEDDRGKGLQDMLEFIRQRKEGCLSIHSYKGSYTCNFSEGRRHNTSKSYRRPLYGTLITWSITLARTGDK